jgi:hypothetical protein
MSDLCNASELERFVDELWDRSIVPTLCEYDYAKRLTAAVALVIARQAAR